jgi:hypothetical protein
MPASGPPRSSDLDDATRRQLDELEALMQRMLALPVDHPEEGPADALDTHTEAPVTKGNPELAKSAQADMETQVRPAASLDTAAANSCGTPSLPGTSLIVPLPHERESEAPVQVRRNPVRPVARSSRPFVAWWLLPVLWINQAYDGGVGWMGPPGRWLRGTPARTFLGAIGLLLLAAALAWVIHDGIDWTW